MNEPIKEIKDMQDRMNQKRDLKRIMDDRINIGMFLLSFVGFISCIYPFLKVN